MKDALTQVKAFGAKLLKMILSERVLKMVFFKCAHALAKKTTNDLDDQVIKELESMFDK